MPKVQFASILSWLVAAFFVVGGIANATAGEESLANYARWGYAQRLGLWGGDDFPFANRAEFVEAVENGGVAAMEVLARDLRALGLYTARSLSYDGVEYELVEHQLTPEQIRSARSSRR